MKKFKILRLLSIVTIAAAGVFGAASIRSSKTVESAKPVQRVDAESWVQGPTVYFVPSDNWVKDNATFRMNFFDGSTYKGVVNMTLEGTGSAMGLFYNRKVYKGVVSNSFWPSRVQFLRFNSTNSTEWNHSGTIYLSDNNGSPVLMMDSTFSNYDDWTTSNSGIWWNANEDFSVYKTSDYSPSSSTGRVFFNNSGTHWADNSTYKGCAVYAWGGSASPRKWTSGSAVYSATVYHLTWFNDDNGMSYGYADIPTDISGYKFVRTTVADEYTTSLGYFSDTSFIPDSFAYVRFGLSSGNEISSGGAKDDVAGANLMKKVIQAYNTCSSSVLNGYGAYTALNTNFYSHATSAAKAANETSLNGNSATIQAHFDGMMQRSLYGSSSSHNLLFFKNAEKAPTYAVIILISTIGLATIGGYFFYKKRKENI